MDTVRSLDRFHQTTPGLAVFAAVELGLAYVLASLAVDSGFLWEYAFAVILLVGTTQNLVKLAKQGIKHGTSKG